MSSDSEDDDGMRKFIEEQKWLEENANNMFRRIKTSLESNGIVYSTTESHSPLGIRVHVGSSTYSCTAPFYDSDKYELARLTFSKSHKIEIKKIGYFRTAEDLCVTLCTTIMPGVQ